MKKYDVQYLALHDLILVVAQISTSEQNSELKKK